MAARYLSFAPWILHVVADEELVLLDARSNRFLLFGRDTTGEIVAAVEGQPKSPLVEALLAEGALQSAPSMISLNRSRAAGLDDFTWSESVRYKTLYHASCPSTREVLAAGLSLAKACLLLKCVSLCRLLRRDHSSLASSAPAKSIVDLEITALLRATRWLPCKIACLEFSLALRERLAHHGVNGTVEIGVQKYSFMAHAWLEVNGQPLGEPEHVARSLHRLRGTQ
ncbi:lasso peptide biosynthesis B2 protein [Pseudomonas sp. FIP_A4]|uniref:lasso peptide biosynthesis B2 protein n=1 Tax=Pseudomonas sp. FIP_A4 TaxID=3070684 RepID=UPI002FD1A7E8